jgi:hypothetical protein
MADTKAATNGKAPMTLRAGMKRLGSVSNAPWWNIKNGAKLYGEFENMYERPDERSKTGKSKFFQIKLLEDTEVRFGRGKDAKIGTCKAGEVVNLNYGPKTKDLEALVDPTIHGATFNVEVLCNGDKQDIGKGQTMWPLVVGSEMKRAPSVSDTPDFDGSDDEDEAGAATA